MFQIYQPPNKSPERNPYCRCQAREYGLLRFHIVDAGWLSCYELKDVSGSYSGLHW